jgi:hypothetical protein
MRYAQRRVRSIFLISMPKDSTRCYRKIPDGTTRHAPQHGRSGRPRCPPTRYRSSGCAISGLVLRHAGDAQGFDSNWPPDAEQSLYGGQSSEGRDGFERNVFGQPARPRAEIKVNGTPVRVLRDELGRARLACPACLRRCKHLYVGRDGEGHALVQDLFALGIFHEACEKRARDLPRCEIAAES